MHCELTPCRAEPWRQPQQLRWQSEGERTKATSKRCNHASVTCVSIIRHHHFVVIITFVTKHIVMFCHLSSAIKHHLSSSIAIGRHCLQFAIIGFALPHNIMEV